MTESEAALTAGVRDGALRGLARREELRRRAGFQAALGVLLVALLFPGCSDQHEGAVLPQGAQTPGEEIAGLIDMVGNDALPPEVRVGAVTFLAAYDPAETVHPLVAMLAAEEPMVLVAVIENLPQAAEELAVPELQRLASSHRLPKVQAAARARLTEFEEFHQ